MVNGYGRDKRVLVVDDEVVVAEVVEQYLRRDGYDVRVATTGEAGLRVAREWAPDLVVLDVMLPGIDGLEVCRRIRQESLTPIIMLTARGDEADRIVGLELGADDYMVKPVKQAELLARLSALGRRAGVGDMDDQGMITVGPWTIDRGRRQILLEEEAVKLTDKDYELACYLFQNVGKLMSRAHLLEKVWGIMTPIESRTVDVHISRIRRSLQIRPERGYRIKTVYQHGYRLEPMDE